MGTRCVSQDYRRYGCSSLVYVWNFRKFWILQKIDSGTNGISNLCNKGITVPILSQATEKSIWIQPSNLTIINWIVYHMVLLTIFLSILFVDWIVNMDIAHRMQTAQRKLWLMTKQFYIFHQYKSTVDYVVGRLSCLVN